MYFVRCVAHLTYLSVSNQKIETSNEKRPSEKGPAIWTLGRFDGSSFAAGSTLGSFGLRRGMKLRGGARPGRAVATVA